ncbi:24840_t:CDS:2, partial [Gigaspora margarita]
EAQLITIQQLLGHSSVQTTEKYIQYDWATVHADYNPDNPGISYETDEAQKFTANFGGEVFAKLTTNGKTIYYRKEIPILPANKLPLVIPNQYREIIFEFTEKDIVIKNEKESAKVPYERQLRIYFQIIFAGSHGEIIFCRKFLSLLKSINTKRIVKDAPAMVRKPTSSVKKEQKYDKDILSDKTKMKDNQLTKTETKYLRPFAKKHILLPTKFKKPLVDNWNKYYVEYRSIERLLEINQEYSLRTGTSIGNYCFIAIDLDDI